MHLKRGLSPLWRDDLEVQIGVEERISHRLTLQDPREYLILEALTIDHTLPQLRGILIREHYDPSRADAIVGELVDAGVVQGPTRGASQLSIPRPARELLAPAAESRALTRDDDGWPPIMDLVASSVHVVGLGRTGARVAATLAASGVGHLLLTDPSPVTPRDCGLDYTQADIGQPRDAVMRSRVRSMPGACVPFVRTGAETHVTVMVDCGVYDILRARDLMYQGSPHLLVLIGEASSSVGPWVSPGHGPCLRCLALHSTDEDPLWPTMATQLANSHTLGARGEDPALASLVGCYAASQVVAALTGYRPPCADLTIAFALPDYSTRAIRWSPHPECGCIAPVTGQDNDFAPSEQAA
ncbi:MAG: ThiF family adenylyltransferase [Bifidobacteriaceae bacterium]|nr:ThiF family adenylyltransferase [Bifidobacteriaceae bacterium]